MDEENTCRTCTRRQKSSLMSTLDVSATGGTKGNIRYMLEKCVPGMMLDISRNPMICQPCISKLNTCYEFITNCQHVENMITSYLENNKDIQLGSLDLFKMINQTLWNPVNIKSEPSNVIDERSYVPDPVTMENVKVEMEVKTEPLDDDENDDLENYIDSDDYFEEGSEPVGENINDHIENHIDSDDYFEEESSESAIESTLTTPGVSEMQGTASRRNDVEIHYSDCEFSNELNDGSKYKKRSFRCDQCQYKAYNQRLLEMHRKFKCKKSQKLYSCKLCDFESPRQHSLKRHMLTHGGERPYVCKYCKKGFVEQCVYKLHLLTHTDNERPHRCSDCDSSFLRMWDLKMHMRRSHSANDRLKCGKCSKTFADKRSLEAHHSQHMGKFKYNCSDCDFATSWKKNLVRHIENAHS